MSILSTQSILIVIIVLVLEQRVDAQCTVAHRHIIAQADFEQRRQISRAGLHPVKRTRAAQIVDLTGVEQSRATVGHARANVLDADTQIESLNRTEVLYVARRV